MERRQAALKLGLRQAHPEVRQSAGMMRPTLSAGLKCLFVTLIILTFTSPAVAINGGAAVANAAARPPHVAIGATVWQNGNAVPLQEPCTAVLVCQNVILTAAHCLNFNSAGNMYYPRGRSERAAGRRESLR